MKVNFMKVVPARAVQIFYWNLPNFSEIVYFDLYMQAGQRLPTLEFEMADCLAVVPQLLRC